MSRMRKRVLIRRKLHTLRALISSKSVKKSSIIKDAFFYIFRLQLKLEATRREYSNHVKRIEAPTVEEVKVEKVREGFSVRVRSERGGDFLVSILEAFEELRLNVLHAKVSRNNCSFAMEAIVEAPNKALDAGEVTSSVLKAIGAKED